MIITDSKVVKYIEAFEAVKAENPLPDTELSVVEQKALYTIIEMFSMDKVFRLYISLLLRDFAKKRITLGGEELSEALVKVIDFAAQLNNKGE